ncbi:hypothetical protein EFT40_02485 [Lentilactobacillus parabuchneri]|nr:hypothetical protein [Lentilactobacillus parabuchneri]TLQ30527.1 hypothetical protein FEZ39_08255 [Lentilactobacillus parabuchneri]
MGFAVTDCEHTLSTVLWITFLALDIFSKNAGTKNNSCVHKPVDNSVDNLLISPLFCTGQIDSWRK